MINQRSLIFSSKMPKIPVQMLMSPNSYLLKDSRYKRVWKTLHAKPYDFDLGLEGDSFIKVYA